MFHMGAKNRAWDYNGKNCSTLTAAATANCKGWNTLLNTHKIFLQLTSFTNCQLEEFVTSAHIFILRNLPSQALFTMQSTSQSCATTTYKFAVKLLPFFDSAECLKRLVKHFFLVSHVGADKLWQHTVLQQQDTENYSTCMPEWLWYPGCCGDILCLLQLPPDHKMPGSGCGPLGLHCPSPSSALPLPVTGCKCGSHCSLFFSFFYCQKKHLMDVHRHPGVWDALGLMLGQILMLQCNL